MKTDTDSPADPEESEQEATGTDGRAGDHPNATEFTPGASRVVTRAAKATRERRTRAATPPRCSQTDTNTKLGYIVAAVSLIATLVGGVGGYVLAAKTITGAQSRVDRAAELKLYTEYLTAAHPYQATPPWSSPSTAAAMDDASIALEISCTPQMVGVMYILRQLRMAAERDPGILGRGLCGDYWLMYELARNLARWALRLPGWRTLGRPEQQMEAFWARTHHPEWRDSSLVTNLKLRDGATPRVLCVGTDGDTRSVLEHAGIQLSYPRSLPPVESLALYDCVVIGGSDCEASWEPTIRAYLGLGRGVVLLAGAPSFLAVRPGHPSANVQLDALLDWFGAKYYVNVWLQPVYTVYPNTFTDRSTRGRSLRESEASTLGNAATLLLGLDTSAVVVARYADGYVAAFALERDVDSTRAQRVYYQAESHGTLSRDDPLAELLRDGILWASGALEPR